MEKDNEELEFFEEDDFEDFHTDFHETIDQVVHSMFLQWKACQEAGFEVDYFDNPKAIVIDDVPEGFGVEVREKVDGSGFIAVQNSENALNKELFVWRLKDDGTFQVALKTKEGGEPLDKDTLEACIEILTKHYEGKEVSVEPLMRDHFFTLYSGIKDEEEKEE